jgi:hypothetical protein
MRSEIARTNKEQIAGLRAFAVDESKIDTAGMWDDPDCQVLATARAKANDCNGNKPTAAVGPIADRQLSACTIAIAAFRWTKRRMAAPVFKFGYGMLRPILLKGHVRSRGAPNHRTSSKNLLFFQPVGERENPRRGRTFPIGDKQLMARSRHADVEKSARLPKCMR